MAHVVAPNRHRSCGFEVSSIVVSCARLQSHAIMNFRVLTKAEDGYRCFRRYGKRDPARQRGKFFLDLVNSRSPMELSICNAHSTGDGGRKKAANAPASWASRFETASLDYFAGASKGGVAHAKLRAKVFRKQLNSRTVPGRIGLGQILNRPHQEMLALHVSRVGSGLPLTPAGIGNHGNRQDLGHASLEFRDNFNWTQSIVRSLSELESHWSRKPSMPPTFAHGPSICVPPAGFHHLFFLLLWVNHHRIAFRLQLEVAFRQRLIDLDVGVAGQLIVAAGVSKLLLSRHSQRGIDP